jgi:maltooligosyltrehalose trehalohydrolase
MLFMGEEFAASTPFQYFCDFGPELAQAVSRGRRAEFARFAAFASEQAQSRIPDPNSASTFLASKLNWVERSEAPHRLWLARVQQLLAVRRKHLVPLFAAQSGAGRFQCDGDTLRVDWTLRPAAGTAQPVRLHLLAYFGAQPKGDVAAAAGVVIYNEGVESDGSALVRLASGAVRVTLQGVAHA